MTRNQHVRYIPNIDPGRKRINVIVRLEAFVNNPNIKAMSIVAYERGFVVLYEEATSDLRENKHNRRKMAGKERNG
jgi:hypothetical protein